MMTQKQVALDLIGKHVTAYTTLDVSQIYTGRLEKARRILEAGQVHRQKDGSYLVQGSQPEPYLVNGQCPCEDYQREHAPHHWCKHRLAAKLYQAVLVDLDVLRSQGVPHLHFVCEHKSLMELCWAQACPEPMDQVCDSCLGDEWKAETWEVVAAGESLNGDGVYPASTLSPAELAEVAAPVYEENPSPYVCAAPGKGKKVPPKVPMPEAPASLNLKLKLPGGHELMYTMRSMAQGGAGDVELLERLPAVLTSLEALGQDVSPEAPSWLRRLGQVCKLSAGALTLAGLLWSPTLALAEPPTWCPAFVTEVQAVLGTGACQDVKALGAFARKRRVPLEVLEPDHKAYQTLVQTQVRRACKYPQISLDNLTHMAQVDCATPKAATKPRSAAGY